MDFGFSLGGLGGLFGAFGKAQAAKYQTKINNLNLKHQAAMSRVNARINRTNAQKERLNADLQRSNIGLEESAARLENQKGELSLAKGEKQVQQLQNAASKMKGKQRVGYAASGVRLDSRSVQNVLTETDYMAQVDEFQAYANSVADAWSHRLAATGHQLQGANYDLAALNTEGNVLSLEGQAAMGDANADIYLSQQMSPSAAFRSTLFGSILGNSAVLDMFGDIGSSFMDSMKAEPSQPAFQIQNRMPASQAGFSFGQPSHWTQTTYVKDSWDANFSLGRGGFSIDNRMPASQAGFNWWR